MCLFSGKSHGQIRKHQLGKKKKKHQKLMLDSKKNAEIKRKGHHDWILWHDMMSYKYYSNTSKFLKGNSELVLVLNHWLELRHLLLFWPISIWQMNTVEDTTSFVFQRALVFASGVNILNLCSFLIFNNLIFFNKVVLRLGGGRKKAG